MRPVKSGKVVAFELFRTAVVLVCFLAVSYVTILAQISTTKRSPNQPTLPDIGFDVIPLISNYSVSDYAVFAILGVFALWLAIHPFRGLLALRRLGMLLGTCYAIRIGSVLLTVLPDPDQRCMALAKGYNDFILLVPFRYVLGTAVLCSDLIFSGHTCTGLLIVLIVASVERSRIPVVRVGIVALFASLFVVMVIAIIGSRFHYSVDVYIACVVSTLLFSLFVILRKYRPNLQPLAWLDGPRTVRPAADPKIRVVESMAGLPIPDILSQSVNTTPKENTPKQSAEPAEPADQV